MGTAKGIKGRQVVGSHQTTEAECSKQGVEGAWKCSESQVELWGLRGSHKQELGPGRTKWDQGRGDLRKGPASGGKGR